MTDDLKEAIEQLLEYYFTTAEEQGQVDWDKLDTFMENLNWAYDQEVIQHG